MVSLISAANWTRRKLERYGRRAARGSAVCSPPIISSIFHMKCLRDSYELSGILDQNGRHYGDKRICETYMEVKTQCYEIAPIQRGQLLLS